MISLKAGASIEGIQNEVMLGLIMVASVLHEHGYGTVITAGTDGAHMPGSLHHKGQALDIRSKHIKSEVEQKEILVVCKVALGSSFDFILESPSEEIEHFHLEFQPKGNL